MTALRDIEGRDWTRRSSDAATAHARVFGSEVTALCNEMQRHASDAATIHARIFGSEVTALCIEMRRLMLMARGFSLGFDLSAKMRPAKCRSHRDLF